MRKLILLFGLIILSTSVFAENRVLKADFRHRPPEMVIAGENISGPLKDILEEAAKAIDYKISWEVVPFPRSLERLKNGQVDIVPRTIRNKKREEFINYLGPIGYQKKDILFLVRKGRENLINNYEDLYKLRVGVKRGTAYFDKFNDDNQINRVLSMDDHNMAKMFMVKRFDTMIILDKNSIEQALAKISFDDYSYAIVLVI
ncbi:MAG: transporter substrate-binding domain-containing protein [Desulfobacteraceae bacterium]|nr:transporter substrate-binding domain-containing protein [Desulfobacteraceae bacterium]